MEIAAMVRGIIQLGAITLVGPLTWSAYSAQHSWTAGWRPPLRGLPGKSEGGRAKPSLRSISTIPAAASGEIGSLSPPVSGCDVIDPPLRTVTTVASIG